MFDQKEYVKQYYKDHCEEIKAYKNQWRKDNREHCNEYMRQYYRDNLERIRKNHKKYRKNHPEEEKRRHKLYRKNNPEKFRGFHLKGKYNLSYEDWVKMWVSQDGECGEPFAEQSDAHVDHNHKTDEVRGLLCGRCNRGVGHFNDNPKLMMKAIKYLLRKEEIK